MITVRRIVLFVFACALLLGAAHAAEPPTVWHIVRPGENLHLIATRYLGAPGRWPELAQLNPEVSDPNRLEPGQRIRVPGAKGSTAARVARLSRRVETQPTPIPWEDAQQGDLLLDHDGLRTFPRSSAEMAFNDGTRLLVTESSLVFLQKSGGQLQGVERKSVEIVEGQADVEAQAPAAGAARPEVEIVLGPARATARPSATSPTRTRARKPEAGGAKLMVYGGEGEIEAAGSKVAVPEGMGTSVEAQGPPGPPEKLLAAPRLLAPATGSRVECANPRFSWAAVPDAASYTVEVCRDASCASLAERAVGLQAVEWRPTTLPAGDLFWRITARSASGLDGYPAEPFRLAIASDRVDLAGPEETAALVGAQVVVADTVWAGPTARVTATSYDPQSGGPVTRDVTHDLAELTAFAAGTIAAGTSRDACGNTATLTPLPFQVDNQAPELAWEVVDLADFPNRRQGARTPKGLSWSGGARWMALETGAEPLRIRTDAPQLLLHGARFDLGDTDVTPDGNQMLRVRAHDGGAGVDTLTFQLRDDPKGGLVLEIEVVDLVGNVKKVAWGVTR